LRFAALAIVAAFGYGVVSLMLLRFESGDIYQPYSSLRTDPLGTRAFYESLERLDGITVRRNYKPLKKLTRSDGDTLFYIGVDEGWIPDEVETATSRPAEERKSADRAIHEFASKGGRVVISFSPTAGLKIRDPLRELFDRAYEADRDDEEEDDDEDEEDEDEEDEPLITLDDLYGSNSKLGLSISRRDADDWRELHKSPALGVNEVSINWRPVPWRGSIYFKELSDDWTVICQQDDEPVIIERAIGSGSIVICADSYFLSNEAMVGESTRNAPLLAWLTGGPAVIFDETHLGVAAAESISSLAREYGLANVLFVLLAIAGLYVWKSSVSLLPRDPEHRELFSGREVSGKSSALGLHSLLKKCVPSGRLLNECLARWSSSISGERPKKRADREKVRAIVAAEGERPAKKQDPVKAYAKICKILAERK